MMRMIMRMIRTMRWAGSAVAVALALTGCGKSLETNVGGEVAAPNRAGTLVSGKPVAMTDVAQATERVATGPSTVPMGYGEPSTALSAPEPLPVAAPDPDRTDPAPSLEPVAGSGSEPSEIVAPFEVAKLDPDAAMRGTEGRQRDRRSVDLQDIYFTYDSWRITPEGQQVLSMDAEWIRTHQDAVLMIEGHCDDRGTSAYNLVLGERRARAVKKYLVDLGITPERLQIVSYGKERPVCTEANESCYRKNRRGHLVARLPARPQS